MSIIDPRTGEALTAPIEPGQPAGVVSSAGGSGQAASHPPGSGQQDVRREDVIVDVDASNIQQVLEVSMKVPVLLDCWAPWCEPCKNLMPILEKLALEYAGTFILAKLDIEASPDIAGQLGVRSVPDVKLVSQGGLVDSFQGALPEKEIREWLGRYFQPPADAGPSPEEKAEQALAAGDTDAAGELFQSLIDQYPDHPDYQIGLARTRVAEKRGDEARQLLDQLPPETRDGPAARGVRASIEFAEQAPDHDTMAALGERDDSEARYQRALRQVADGKYEDGLEGLLALMKADRGYGDDAARKTLLQVFDALGAEHPLTVAYRRKLFALMY